MQKLLESLALAVMLFPMAALFAILLVMGADSIRERCGREVCE